MVARTRATTALAAVPAAPEPERSATPDSPEGHRNEVFLTGRLAAAAVPKELPSGDQIVTWRLIVDRPLATGPRKVDVLDCTAFGGRVRRQALGWNEGEVIEVTGAVRRRFWRGALGLQSRCEVEVTSAARERGSSSSRRTVATAAVKRPRKPG